MGLFYLYHYQLPIGPHVYFHFQAVVAGPGPGAGSSHYDGSSGAGHGGRGGRGKSQTRTGAFYGDFTRPQAFGSSGGGGSGDSIATGGGVFHITAGEMVHDGQITVNGKDALTNFDYGGGSGGSVFIEAGSFDGSGVIQANGGAGGSSAGGGGSGGRIALHYNSTFFSGTISAYGGASAVETGAAGTIYKRDEQKGYSILEVYNQGRKPSKEEIDDYSNLASDSARTWLTLSHIVNSSTQVSVRDIDLGTTVYEGLSIDEVKLGGSAHIAIEPDDSKTRLHTFRQFYGTFEGDSFGFLHVGPRQLLTIPDTDYYLPVNLKIYQSGYIQLPDRVMLHKNSLSLNAGYLIGVKDLVISQCRVTFGAGSGALSTGSLQAMHFKFQTVTIMSQGFLDMVATNTNYSLDMDSLVINSGGALTGRNVAVVAQTVTVDESGKITLDAKGESCPPTDVYYAGSGGSHAGYGGFGFLGEPQGQRESPFDSVFRPVAFGKAGYAGRSSSSCTSGFGGGILNLTISGTLQIDGEISSR